MRIVTVVLSIVALLLSPAMSAYAVTASDWIPGRIIDDDIFTDGTAMSTTQIQNFLKSKLPYCDKNGAKTSEWGGGTRAQYGAANGNPAPFTCITGYYEVPKTTPSSGIPVNNYGRYNSDGSPYIPSGSKSAAQLISDAAKKYSINPRALLIKIATESPGPLTTDEWPFKAQYYYAMGAHCPDSGTGGSANCDANYAGFSIQIDEAAKLLRHYLDNMQQSWWPYKKPFASNYVLWNVQQSNCGGKNVYIASKATAALYTYTPYQPNAAALNNMYGTGDGCSAYGNRNFWRVWNDWFGPTQNNFVPLDTPRWMVLNKDTQKVDTTTLAPIDDALPTGLQIFYSTKIKLNGQWYLRTKTDSDRKNHKAIPLADISDISPIPFSSPRYMELNSDRYKINPVTGVINRFRQYPAGTTAKFIDKITVNGEDFYRTETSSANGDPFFFRSAGVRELEYEPFSYPRYMRIQNDTSKIDPATGLVDSAMSSGVDIMFNSKVNIGNNWYYREAADGDAGKTLAVPATDIIGIPYTTFNSPAMWMNLDKDSYKLDPLTGQNIRILEKSRYPQIRIARTVQVNGTTYYQSTTDYQRKNTYAIKAEDMSEPAYIPLDNPRMLTLNTDSAKVNPLTGETVSRSYPKGTTALFTTKITVNGTTYLRSEYDTSNSYSRGIEYWKF